MKKKWKKYGSSKNTELHTCQSLLDGGDVEEVFSIGNSKNFHRILVTPFLEMLLERVDTPVAVVATDLLFVHQARERVPMGEIAYMHICVYLRVRAWVRVLYACES